MSELSPEKQIEKSLTCPLWLLHNRIKNERGDPIDLSDHLFLLQIYAEESPKLVCYKAAQVGFTTLAILKQFHTAHKKRMDSIYTLPTQADVYDFVGGKVNRIIQANPILQELCKDRDTMEQKRIGQNVAYYRGTFTEKAAIMVSSDWNIHDEEDRSNQPVIQQYHSRLQHSKHQWEWHFSNPSVEGNGVSRYWPLSDQKHWFIRCSHCNKEQYLNWPDSIDQDKGIYVCKFCHGELTNEDRRAGRWVPRFKDREYSGYWISLLMTTWTPAKEVVRLYKTKSKEYFWNFVLGLPYVGQGNKVTPDIFYRNIHLGVNSYKKVVIGCDSGIVKHYCIGNDEGLFHYGKTESWDEVESLLKRFPDSMMVIDAMPDITKPRELREKYPGRVYLCHYAKDRKTMQLIRWGKHEEAGNVIADRNRMIQLVVDEHADKRIPLFGTRDDWAEFYSHWETLYKITENDSLGIPSFQWLSSNGMDHWCHAEVYWRIGMDRYGFGSGVVIDSSVVTQTPISTEIKPDGTMRNVTPTGEDPIELTLKKLKEESDGLYD